MPERAEVFAKAGWYLALPKPPDLEIDLSLGWKAVDRKANAARMVSLAPGFSPVLRAHGDAAALAAYQRPLV